jgi:hypothetical protein
MNAGFPKDRCISKKYGHLSCSGVMNTAPVIFLTSIRQCQFAHRAEIIFESLLKNTLAI